MFVDGVLGPQGPVRLWTVYTFFPVLRSSRSRRGEYSRGRSVVGFTQWDKQGSTSLFISRTLGRLPPYDESLGGNPLRVSLWASRVRFCRVESVLVVYPRLVSHHWNSPPSFSGPPDRHYEEVGPRPPCPHRSHSCRTQGTRGPLFSLFSKFLFF